MKRSLLALAIIPSLAACSPEPANEVPGPEKRTEQNEPDSGLQLPPGEYRLAGADGEDVNLGHAITVSISEDVIAFSSQCVSPHWTYSYAEGQIVTEPVAKAICERGLYPAEEAGFAVFGNIEQVERTAANGLRISGSGHSITLFSQ